jgi:hypothetical protein
MYSLARRLVKKNLPHPSTGKWRGMVLNLAFESSLFIPIGFLTFNKILQHGTHGFTSPPKEVMLRIFIAAKNPSNLTGFELTNLGSNDKRANY